MAYVFQCDRCGNVGEKHTMTIEVFEVNNLGDKAPGEPRTNELCDACANRLAEVMHDPEDGIFSPKQRTELADQIEELIADLSNRDFKRVEIAAKVVELCATKMLPSAGDLK